MKITIEYKRTLEYLPPDNLAFKIKVNSWENRQANVDWSYYKDLQYNKRNLISAKKQAIKLSLKKDVFEVHLVVYTDDDPIVQEFYKKGELDFKMF